MRTYTSLARRAPSAAPLAAPPRHPPSNAISTHPGEGRRLYTPEHFRETRTHELHALIRAHPLALLVAPLDTGPAVEHLPMQLQRNADAQWHLRGHLARANPLWRRLPTDTPVLAVFRGADHYISPTWYPSRAEHGRAVPTWNYATVHATGTIRFIEDFAWLHALVESLTDEHEQGRTPRWQISDLPPDYQVAQLRAIVGFEITVTELTGKFKASQNRPAADRSRVREALRAEGLTEKALAELVREPHP